MVLARAGMLPLARPDHLLQMLRAMRAFGQIGAISRIGALRHGSAIALDDELGQLDYAALHTRSNSLARALGGLGVRQDDGVAILCRNHRFILDAAFASAKHGARAIFLNTDSAGPQLAEILEREGATTLVYDDEFAERTADARRGRQGVRAWTELPEGPPGEPTIEELIASADGSELPAPKRPGRVVILTSGTSGTPKGANRGQPKTLTVPAALLSRIPLRAGGVTYVAPPLFHSWGLLTASLTLGLGTRLVLRRRFDAAAVLDTLERTRCTTLVVVPVMLRRLLALGEEEVRGRDLAALRVVAVGGSPLSAELCAEASGVLGDVLYNVYGSTEVAQATIADPDDLRAAPGCVGRPPLGTSVKVLDDAGREAPAGTTGRIFVSNAVQFEGYTGGGGKEVIDGMMATGDLGHIDAGGRLLIDGRDDEMVISGAEKVFPAEVEEVLARHPSVEEAAVTGVPDEEFGQRLRAFVVARPGAGLTEDHVRDHVRENLARYKVPRDVVFMERLPRNATGKVLKRELTGDRAAD
ncbi:MAG TPA: AMP-binding protein [Thermoleophilaceae bacterium]